MNRHEVDPLEAGWDAFEAGLPLETPTPQYERGTIERARWESGWHQAEANYGEN